MFQNDLSTNMERSEEISTLLLENHNIREGPLLLGPQFLVDCLQPPFQAGPPEIHRGLAAKLPCLKLFETGVKPVPGVL